MQSLQERVRGKLDKLGKRFFWAMLLCHCMSLEAYQSPSGFRSYFDDCDVCSKLVPE